MRRDVSPAASVGTFSSFPFAVLQRYRDSMTSTTCHTPSPGTGSGAGGYGPVVLGGVAWSGGGGADGPGGLPYLKAAVLV